MSPPSNRNTFENAAEVMVESTALLGKIDIWKDIIVNTILALVCFAIATTVQSKYRRGFKSVNIAASSRTCDAVQTVQTKCGKSKCSKRVLPCRYTVALTNASGDTREVELAKSYSGVTQPPVQTTLRVHYNPADVSTATLWSGHKGVIVGTFSLVGLGFAGGAAYKYALRNNKALALAEGGGVLVGSMF